MRSLSLITLSVALLAVLTTQPCVAEVVYTQTTVSIPVGGSYSIDLNGDGVADFTLRSKLIQGWCQLGDEYTWTLTVIPSSGNWIVTDAGRVGSSNAAALPINVPVNSTQSFYPSEAIMAGLYWGPCGTGMMGEWLGATSRYLGFRFQGTDGQTRYGWAEVSASAFVDRFGHLQTSTILLGFAYETAPGQTILTGQTTD